VAGLYQPPGSAVPTLGRITNLFVHPRTQTINIHLTGKKFMCKFANGQLFYESKLDLDTDGSVFSAQDVGPNGEQWGQMTTSAKDVDGHSLDADLINYFVLPGGFYAAHGITIGDIGVVIYGARKVYACFGDVGPQHKLGEGSISLHRELGHETIVNRNAAAGGTLVNSGISSGVITIVFPGSGNGLGRSNAECATIGEPLFQDLQRQANPVGDFPAFGARNIA
jgi:hypothetical protein